MDSRTSPAAASDPDPPSPRGGLAIYGQRHMLVLAALGFAGGLPLFLSGSTLMAWLSVAGIRPATIGFFSLASLPYSLKFLVAPLIDRFALGRLGRRRSWLLLSQSLLLLTLLAMAAVGPNVAGRPAEASPPPKDAATLPLAPAPMAGERPPTPEGLPLALWMLGGLAMLLATFSAIQDVAGDAYRADVLTPPEMAAGAAVWVAAYRTAMILASGAPLIAAPWIGWPAVYLALACLMGIGITGTLLAREPAGQAHRPTSLTAAVYEPMRAFVLRYGWQVPTILALVALFRLPEDLANKMRMTLLLTELQFSQQAVGLAESTGIGVSIVGAFLGGVLVPKLGMRRSLLIFGAAMALANGGYWLLEVLRGGQTMMFAVCLIDSFALGLVTAGFLGFLMSLCDQRYSALQFALLTSLMRVAGSWLGAYTGQWVEAIGYGPFFLLTIALGLPGLLLAAMLRPVTPPAAHNRVTASD